MWELEQANIRARAEKRIKKNKERKNKLQESKTWRMVRIPFTMRVTHKFGEKPIVVNCSAMLHEATTDSIRIFSPISLEPGSRVTIHIDLEEDVYLRGEVVWSHKHESSWHLITQFSSNYRIGIKLQWNSFSERSKLNEFLKTLKMRYFFVARPL